MNFHTKMFWGDIVKLGERQIDFGLRLLQIILKLRHG